MQYCTSHVLLAILLAAHCLSCGCSELACFAMYGKIILCRSAADILDVYKCDFVNLCDCDVSWVQVLGLEGVKVTSVACGWRHSIAADETGVVYTFGWSKYGQLGHGDCTYVCSPF